jgi:hypothetical protein
MLDSCTQTVAVAQSDGGDMQASTHLAFFLDVGLLGVALRVHGHELPDGHAAGAGHQARQPAHHHGLHALLHGPDAQHQRRDRHQPIVRAQHQRPQPRRPVRVVLVLAHPPTMLPFPAFPAQAPLLTPRLHIRHWVHLGLHRRVASLRHRNV